MPDPLAKVRKTGAPVRFNPAMHTDIVGRMTLMGCTPDEISAAMGVTMETYSRWLEEYPELEDARIAAEQADEVAMKSLHELVRGWRNPETGVRQAPNVAEAVCPTKVRMGWSVLPSPPPHWSENLAQIQIGKRARSLTVAGLGGC